MRGHLLAAEVGVAAAQATLGEWLPLAAFGAAVLIAGVMALRESRKRRIEQDAEEWLMAMSDAFHWDEAARYTDAAHWN